MDEAGSTIAIVGGGQAGGAAILRLRQLEYHGRIVLVTDEDALPYDRPGLSKEYLLGGLAAARPLLNEMLPNERALTATRALGVDPAGRTVRTGSGTVQYDRLLLATGAGPRPMTVAGASLAGIHPLRTAADAARIADGFALCGAQHRPLLVVGGSWIGLEVAAAARQRGLRVVLVEQADRLCQRTVPATVSARLRSLHEANGVDVRLHTQVVRFDGDVHVREATLSDGTTLEPGAVVVGIGVLPNLDLARAAELHVRQGIVVDALGRTSDPCIYAAGDAAEVPCGWQARPTRYETWASANAQARVAADSMLRDLGRCDVPPSPVPEPPGFWSDQYGRTLRLAGSPVMATDHEVISDDDKGFVEGFFTAGRLIGLAAIGHNRAFRDLRRGIEALAA